MIVFLGDFYFNYSNDTEKKDGENKIIDLMNLHNDLYGEFQKESQYVTSGAKLVCSAGTKLTLFDIPVDHSVVKNGVPVGICSECERNKNIYSFGGCKQPTPQGTPKRKVIVVGNSPSRIYEMEKCIPVLNKIKGWQQTTGTYLKVWNYEDKKYYNVITTGDYLTCFYGGIIKVIEASTIDGSYLKWHISPEGFVALKNHETNPSTLIGWGLAKLDKNNVIIGIYPHYVFRISKTTGQWESDGGITFGFGHYVSKSEYQTVQDEKALVDQYAKGAALIPTTIPTNGVSYIVPNSSYMTISDAKNLLMKDIREHEEDLNNVIDGYSYPITQTQFDALVDLRYHKYKLGADIDDLLSKKSTSSVDWKNAIDTLIGPKGDLNRAKDLVDLFNKGVYPK